MYSVKTDEVMTHVRIVFPPFPGRVRGRVCTSSQKMTHTHSINTSSEDKHLDT